MKICPFISHLLGEGSSSMLAIGARTAETSGSEAAGDVVVLGYDNDGDSAVQTGVATDTETKKDASSHLHCLKESCRFYQKPARECQFDLMYARLKEMESNAQSGNTDEIVRDIDKIWKFQTKGVTEIVETLADTEKKHAQTLGELKREFVKKVDDLAGTLSQTSVQSVQNEIEALKHKVDERHESFDSLSTTISDFVTSLEENLKEIKTVSDGLSHQVSDIKSSMPHEESIAQIVRSSLDQAKTGPSAFDAAKPIRDLEEKLDAVAAPQKEALATLQEKLDATVAAHRETAEKLSAWREEIVDRVSSLSSRQENWERRIEELLEHQKAISSYLETGNKQREEQEVRHARKESRKYNNLGVASFHNGAFEMARDQFLQAANLDQDFAEAYNNLGLAYTELNEEEKATDAFKRAVEINPSLHAAYNNLGYIMYKQGNYEQAVEMYNEALGRSTKNGPAYTNLGNAYYRLGRMDKAREAWTRALEIDPANEKAKKNLQRLNDGGR